jgi:hypothetical protein
MNSYLHLVSQAAIDTNYKQLITQGKSIGQLIKKRASADMLKIIQVPFQTSKPKQEKTDSRWKDPETWSIFGALFERGIWIQN